MNRITIQSLLSLLVAGMLTWSLAAAPAIGIAVANGAFLVDRAHVSGNASLFEGNTIETGKSPSEVQIYGGVRMQLASASRGKVYQDRMVLEQGQAQFESDKAYRVEALSLRVSAARKSVALVSIEGRNRILVTAMGGPVQVASAKGMLLANLAAGRALEFEPQAAGAAAPSKVTGTLKKGSGFLVITDEITGVTVEVRGAGLDDQIGKRVELTGTLDPSATPPAGISEVLKVTNINVLGGTTAAATGMALSTKAIIGGVIVAGAGAGVGLGVTAADSGKDSLSRQ